MKKVCLIAIILIFSGCATAYQPAGATGGYTSTQLDTNVFEVLFSGNGFTPRSRASDFALLRSAEIAIENGYEYFVIIGVQQYSKNSSYTTPTTSTTDFTANTYLGNTYGSAYTTTYGGQTHHVSKPRSSNTIVCFKEKPKGFSYNARFIEKSLKKKHQLNKPNKKK